MKNTVTNVTKPVISTITLLQKHGIELNLDTILMEEFKQGLANDLDNPV
ncbi:MAG: hypothetical protein AAFQ80_02825 [Cyanobacteria bacterium J06621_8]